MATPAQPIPGSPPCAALATFIAACILPIGGTLHGTGAGSLDGRACGTNPLSGKQPNKIGVGSSRRSGLAGRTGQERRCRRSGCITCTLFRGGRAGGRPCGRLRGIGVKVVCWWYVPRIFSVPYGQAARRRQLARASTGYNRTV